MMRPTWLLRTAIVLKLSTIMNFHRTLVKQKYRLLFMPGSAENLARTGPRPN